MTTTTTMSDDAMMVVAFLEGLSSMPSGLSIHSQCDEHGNLAAFVEVRAGDTVVVSGESLWICLADLATRGGDEALARRCLLAHERRNAGEGAEMAGRAPH